MSVCLQEDEDGHLTALQIIQDLMDKCQDIFLEYFARLGVFGKVLSLAGPPSPGETVAVNEDTPVRFVFCVVVPSD